MSEETELPLHEKIAALEAQIKRTSTLWRWRFIYPLVAVFVSMFVTVGVSIVYTTATISDNEQTWCELVGNLDKQYQATPPPTENGRVFATQIHHISTKFRCK